jgi:hypothetical protein
MGRNAALSIQGGLYYGINTWVGFYLPVGTTTVTATFTQISIATLTPQAATVVSFPS